MPSDTPSYKLFEREGWQQRAAFYDDRGGRMTAQAVRPMLDAVGAAPGVRLLDVCCGPGYAAGAAAARGAVATGVDIAPAMLEEGRRRFPAAGFREGDAEALPFADGDFDAVTCGFGLLHLPDPEKAFAEAFRVLAPSGRYAFTVWCAPEKAHLLGLALQAIGAYADMDVPLPAAPPMFRFSDPAKARSALEAAGFRDVATQEIDIAFHGAAAGDVFDWFDKSAVRTMALFRLQSPSVQQQISRAILEGASAFAANGRVRIPCPAMLYAATRPGD